MVFSLIFWVYFMPKAYSSFHDKLKISKFLKKLLTVSRRGKDKGIITSHKGFCFFFPKI